MAIRQDLELRNTIAAVEDLPAAAAACRLVAQHLGFRYFLYGLRLPVSISTPRQYVVSGYPLEWRARYDLCGYMLVDPVLARGMSSILPFGWDELDLDRPGARSLFEDAGRHGLCHGFSVPVHGAHGETGLMNFARHDKLPAGAARARLFQRALWLTTYAQERMRVLILAAEASPPPRLTARERDCLRLAARGLSAHGIGSLLEISESTVTFHLNAAERKLGVRTRGHAIARAVFLGLVDPDGYPARIAGSQQLIELPC